MYKKHRIHFVGIGGIGMSGIAEVLVNLKYPVSGSDLKSSWLTRRLRKKGARIHYGHEASHLGDAEIIVVSSAISPDNPELEEAKKRGLPIIQRAEMLSELMRFSKFGVAVSGTHGKTTTTSLVATLLHTGGLDPTILIGGRVNSLRSNARLGRGDFMVAEADESDGSFLKLSPVIAVITNIDREHMDYYRDFEKVKEAYRQFACKVPFYGAVVCCLEHPVVRELASGLDKRVITYGLSEEADFRANRIVSQGHQMIFELEVHGQPRGEIRLNIPGRHNVLNALAAIAVGDELGIPLKKISQGLARFKGIQRRCEILAEGPQAIVVDDYGHHPEEIKATLSTLKEVYPGRRLVCLFQPHRYTRTHDLFDELVGAFDQADILLVTDIYPASEKPIPGVTSEALVSALQKRKGGVTYLPRVADPRVADPKTKNLASRVIAHLKTGDLLLSLGAGDVTKVGKECAKLIT